MSQTDGFHIPNLAGAPFRNLLNQILAALSDQNAGSTEPANPFAGMVWLDTSTSNPIFKLRNAANTGWVKIFTAEHPPTKAQVGLGNVPNYSATSSLSDGSASKLLLAVAGKTLQDNKLDKTGQAYDSARLGNKLANQFVQITGTYPNLRAQATTKADVGLGNVQNYGITSSLTSNNGSQYLSAKGGYDLNQMKVNKTTTVNGKPLSTSITLTAANVGALPASGSNLGGPLNYTPDTGDILKVDGKVILRRISAAGGLSFGGDDALIIGSGEARQTLQSNVSATAEVLHLGSDNEVEIYTNLQAGWGSGKKSTFETDGGFRPANAAKTRQNLDLKEIVLRNIGVNNFNDIPTAGQTFLTVESNSTSDVNNYPTGLNSRLCNPTAPNAPPNNVYHYITTYAYGLGGNKTQLAIPYNGSSIWTRYKFQGDWSLWSELAPTNSFLKPTTNTFLPVTQSSRSYTFPVGGTWAYWLHGINSGTGGWNGSSSAGVSAGGTTVTVNSGNSMRGFVWRVA